MRDELRAVEVDAWKRDRRRRTGARLVALELPSWMEAQARERLDALGRW